MTTPDPDRKSAPFEWRALTINKVEKIQLARLHEEQDRIEKELREHEALERAARQLEAKEREGEALEQAWFDEGTAQPRDTLDDHDTQKERAAFTPLKRLSYSLTAFGRRLLTPAPKPRSSVPPPPLNESPISLSLVLAACAFGGSVYLSLRWIAEVRQANVTQQLSSSVNATTPAANAAQALREEPRPGLQAPAMPVSAAMPVSSATPVSAAMPVSAATPVISAMPLSGSTPPVVRAFTADGSARSTPAPTVPALEQPASMSSLPQPSRQVVASPDVAAPPPVSSQPTVRSRVLVPAAGSPHSSGTRVYRGGE